MGDDAETSTVSARRVSTGIHHSCFGCERPDFIPHLIHSSSASFPSGHAASAAAVYLTFGFAIASLMARRVLRYYALGTSLLIAFLIGVSRIYLGVHCPSDVVAGWCVGAAWASAVWLVADRLQR
ncbi:MAG: phosphatase PAP2 family protein [Pseudomonadota bacterium]